MIVTQTCTAGGGGTSIGNGSRGSEKAASNDGLGDTGTSVITFIPQTGEETNNNDCKRTLYTAPAGASPFQVKCSPSASATAPNGPDSASVTYTASVSPITVSLGGTLKDGSGKPVLSGSGNQQILVGQGCSASLSGIPSGCTVSNYSWSVSGTTFQDWEPTTPPFPKATPPTLANSQASYELDGYGPATNPTAHWYWNDLKATTEMISCTATVTPPAGQGAAFSVTATQKVSVYVPGWTATSTGGYMQVNTACPDETGVMSLWAGPTAGEGNGGMNWSANVMSSALFTSGTLELVQTVTPAVTYVTYTGFMVPGVTHTDPENGKLGLDTRYPYHWNTYGSYNPPTIAVPYTTFDDPWLTLGGVGSAVLKDQFSDYLMFMPPGSDSKWVPLATNAWGVNGSATIPTTGNWADYVKQNGSDAAGTVSPTANTPFTASNTFPSWKLIDVFPAF